MYYHCSSMTFDTTLLACTNSSVSPGGACEGRTHFALWRSLFADSPYTNARIPLSRTLNSPVWSVFSDPLACRARTHQC